MKLSAIVLAKNEEDTIEQCLQGLSFADEIILIDDSSSDKTVEIATSLGAKIITYTGEDNFARKRNFGLQHAKGEWVLFIDADERVSIPLKDEILRAISSNKYNGYCLLRSDSMWGQTLRFGESAKYPLLRLAKKNKGQWVGSVHEIWDIPENTGYLTNVLHHYPHPTLNVFLKEINHYSSLRAVELYKSGEHASVFSIILYTKGKFIQNYFLKLGIYDGIPGLISALMMSFYSFLVRAKLWQMKNITSNVR